MTTGQLIKFARKKAGMTQASLAEKAGTATGTIQQYELEKRQPRLAQLQAIAAALDVPMSYFFGIQNPHGESSLQEAAELLPGAVVTHFEGNETAKPGLYIDLAESGLFDHVYEDAHSLVDQLNEVGALKSSGYMEKLLEDPHYRRQKPVKAPPADSTGKATPAPQATPESTENG